MIKTTFAGANGVRQPLLHTKKTNIKVITYGQRLTADGIPGLSITVI